MGNNVRTKPDWPIVVDDDFMTINGILYHRKDGNAGWTQLECYLPAATGTYSESFENTFKRFVGWMRSGKMKIKTKGGNTYHFNGERMVHVAEVIVKPYKPKKATTVTI